MYQPIRGTGDGSAPVVTLNFPYLDESHVKASVDGVDATFTWTGVSQITFSGPVASGASWEVYRDTSISETLVDFSSGAVLTEADLDKANAQHQYIDQELNAGVLAAQSSINALSDMTPAFNNLTAAIAATPNATAHAPDRATLALLGTGAPAFLSGEGMFEFSTGDHSADVTADPRQILTVPPQSDPTGVTGAWRRSAKGPLNAALAGLLEGDDQANGPANTTAMAALFTVAAHVGSLHIQFPGGTYWFADNGSGAGMDIASGNIILEGSSAAGLFAEPGPAFPSVLKFPAGVTGIRIQNEQSSGAKTKDAAAHASGGGSIIRNLVLEGAFTGTEADAYGVQVRRMATIENLTIRNFEGEGIYISASLGAASGDSPAFGNANISRVLNTTVMLCRDGIAFEGTDANACNVVGLNAVGNRRWGIRDDSFLGNTFLGGQVSDNGITSANDGITVGATIVSYSGLHYGAIRGQEAWCQTNAPSGTTADNQGWYYLEPTGTFSVPAWTSGMLVRAGGAITDSSDAGRSFYSGVYVEQDEGKCQLSYHSFVEGGEMAEWLYQGGAGVASLKGGLNGVLQTGTAVVAEPALDVVSGKVHSSLGSDSGNPLDVITSWAHKDTCIPGYQLQFAAPRTGTDAVIRLTYGGGGGDVFWVSTPTSFENFGTGTPLPHVFMPVSFALSDGTTTTDNARRFTTGAAAPTSGIHAEGEVVFSRTPTAGQPLGWRCTVAGTPGTWVAFYGDQAAAQANSAAPDIATIVADFNSLLGKLRTAGVIAP